MGRNINRKPICAAVLILLCSIVLSEGLAHSSALERDLSELSLEDLMNIEITSAAKKTQRVSEASAAVFVITQEDIARSGATSIPELLRMVPGIQVARIDANKWAITSRGFNGRFANKLLVLMDGRSVYTPLFSGVFWAVQDTLLEDIDRIEVIRGPGASLWGANAVNGVINIITKKASETNGGLVSAGGGTEERGFGSVRYGAKLQKDTDCRLYAKYTGRDDSVDAEGRDAADGWDALQAGFRLDWQGIGYDSYTFQGDIYDADAGDELTVCTLDPPYRLSEKEHNDARGASLLGRWKREMPGSSATALQFYYDRMEFGSGRTLGANIDTVDIDFSHMFSLYEDYEIMWGLGYRQIRAHIDNTFCSSIYPSNRIDNLLSAFIQTDAKYMGDRLCLTLGSKFEHSDYTGLEIQPNARLIWTPGNNQSVWAAVSRAVRTPSIGESSADLKQHVLPPGTYPGAPTLPVVVTMIGDKGFKSEDLVAYEIGYRIRPVEQLSFDIAAYYNVYDNLLTIEPGSPQYSASLPYIVYPVGPGNKMEGTTHGVEFGADWYASNWVRVKAAYTYMAMDLDIDPDSLDKTSEGLAKENPRNMLSLRSCFDITKGIKFDLWARYVDDIPGQHVDGYATLDARLAFRPKENLEISIVGRNLLDDRHQEFKQLEYVNIEQTEVERSVYGKIAIKF